MSKKLLWWKGAVLVLAAGTTLAMYGNGCLQAVVQRILVDYTFA